MAFPKPEKTYSYADYLTWDESERWEIIGGIPYMQAAPSTKHQEVLMEISRQISNYLSGKSCKVYPAPFCVRLDLDENDNNVKNVVEPDITIACDKSKIDDKGHKGAPDMIVEILSPSSGRNDKVLKFNKYEQAGVKEYWIVEPNEKIVSVFILQTNGKYGRPDMFVETDKIKISIFDNFEIDLKLVFSE
ncbi:MAG: Uma2 family endonuclease [Oligoflexia bacterium]|nr:Uma2 family endonuclease [Oligoflexia bacterium]